MGSKLSGLSAAYRGIACLHQRPLRERAVSAQETRVHHISFSELTNTCWTAWSAGINARSCDLLCESKTRPQALPPIRARPVRYNGDVRWKTLIAALTLATLIVARAFASSAGAAHNPRHNSAPAKQNYDPIYKGYPLSKWYLWA